MSDPWQDDPPKGLPDLHMIGRLWPFVRPYRHAFGVGLLILIGSFALELLGPWLIRQAIDGPMRESTAPVGDRLRALYAYGGGLLAVTVLRALLGYLFGRLTAWNGQRVVRDVRAALFRHLLHLGQPFHERHPAGRLTTRVTSDVENLNELIATGVLQSVFDLLKIVGVLMALALLDLRLALFTLGAIPVVIGISLVFRRNAARAYRSVRGHIAQLNGHAAELIGGIRATRAYGRNATVLARYAELNRRTSQSWRDTAFHFSVFFSLVDLALRITTIGMLWIGGSAVLRGDLTVGQFVQFWIYFGLLATPIRELGEKYNVLQSAFASAERVLGILAEPVFPPRGAGAPAAAPARGAAEVRFRGVSFGYHRDLPVLRDVDFRAPPGALVAIVGPTGAGKSTILQLIARLREVDGGAVEIAGRDVRQWPVDALRERIAFVAQDLFLFTGSVLDNLRLFDASIEEARAWHWLEVVGADGFVRRLPQGIHSPVEERGGTFSQGERQLLAFARALLREPDVLVLDEATASIDSESEARLQQALGAALRGRTALVVAHRLSTVRAADLILVLDQGRIVERGTHPELVALGGRYARMLGEAGAA
jgi:ATP-binding cassette subfamily B multidrug efflux pump